MTNNDIKEKFLLAGYEDLELSTQMIIREAIKRKLKIEFLNRRENFIRISDGRKSEIIKQATKTSIDSYITSLKLRVQEVYPLNEYPPFEHPIKDLPVYNEISIQNNPHLTALWGAVFDMRSARNRLECVKDLFGGRDITLFIIKRLDSSDGNETIDDIKENRISEPAKKYLNAYLNEFAVEFTYAGRYVY